MTDTAINGAIVQVEAARGTAGARKLSGARGRLNTVFAMPIVLVAGYMLYRNCMALQS